MQFAIDSTALIMIDIQEKLVGVQPDLPPRLPKIAMMLRAAAALKLDVIVTEQYPKGLGATIPELKELCRPEWPAIAKTSFSCWGEETFRAAMKSKKRQTAVLMGIEGHVCVQQTAVDLMIEAYDVVLLADAVASRRREDCEVAIDLMRARGVWVTTAESFLFALLGNARHPDFKAISALIK